MARNLKSDVILNNNGTAFNLREIRESLAAAEQLARASMKQVPETLTHGPDPNNNDDAPNRNIVDTTTTTTTTAAYVPPKQLLLYLVRMGSFTSAPKITNGDYQDDDIDLSQFQQKYEDLKLKCRLELCHLPPLLSRSLVPVASRQEPNIRLLQWNILSQSLGEHNDNFVCCPPEALSWQVRRFRILEEILEYCPDIVCLQEVDHYKFLARALKTQGYSGTFFPKPDSPCIYIKDNNGPDGCAIFFREDLFEIVRIETRIVEVWRVQSNQVVILAILRHKETSKEICVATTHLKARQGALLSTLRNEQGKDILEFLENQAGNRPVIICGDFNAEPIEPVYSTMLSNQRLGLDSAYRALDGNEPAYTTWKVRGEGEMCHTIDYVFYSRKHMQVQQLLQFPLADEIGEGRVPSFQYPSDHFSLVVDFNLSKD